MRIWVNDNSANPTVCFQPETDEEIRALDIVLGSTGRDGCVGIDPFPGDAPIEDSDIVASIHGHETQRWIQVHMTVHREKHDEWKNRTYGN